MGLSALCTDHMYSAGSSREEYTASRPLRLARTHVVVGLLEPSPTSVGTRLKL